jgi:hypothetical protein
MRLAAADPVGFPTISELHYVGIWGSAGSDKNGNDKSSHHNQDSDTHAHPWSLSDS